MTMERCHLLGRAIIAVEPGVGHVRLSDCQNLTHRVNACVVQARLGSHSSHGGAHSHILESWPVGPGTTQLPHLPTTISHTAPCQGRMGANKQDDMWEESQIRRQERDLPKCNQATFTLCISTLYVCRQGRIIGHRDNPDNATSAARR